MNIPELFIRRPVMTTLITAGILIFGVMGYRLLPVSDLPNVDYPSITVTASLPGASPETMASSVATPLEKQFSTISGIDEMTSTSGLGSTRIGLTFSLDRSVDAAAQDVQAAISKTLRQLPPGIVPPSYSKSNPADAPIIYYALTSKTLPLSQLDEYGETMLAQRISTVAGVAQVQVYGSQKYAVRIQLDPRSMAYRKIGIDEVVNAVNSGNANLPTGTLWGPNRAYTVTATGQIQDAAGFRPLIVATRNGLPVRLQDVGRVEDDVQDNKVASWFNGDRSIVLAIQRQPGTNTVAVADAVHRTMAALQKELPAAVNLQLLFDRSQSIRASANDVKFTLYLTLALVVMVIFLFLRNIPATIIPSMALPLSVVGTFAAMYLLGFSIDNLSMMALTLSVGFVVDDAIVMLENIVRHVEMGKPVLQAALDGSAEIGFTIVSMTLSLAAVFIPVLFMAGLLGRLFHEFAMTIGIAILISGFISLTLTPMMCSRLLKPGHHEQHGRLYQATERAYDGVLHWYQRTLAWVMDHRPATMVFSAVILVATVALFIVSPKGFLPSEDTGQLNITTEAMEGTSFESMLKHQQEIAAIVGADSNVAGYSSSIGAGGPNSAANQGRLLMRLKPRADRPGRMNIDQLTRSLQRKLATVPGIQAYVQNPPSIRLGGRPSKSLYQYTMEGSDISQLYRASSEMLNKLRALPGLQDVTSDLQISSPQIQVKIDRDRASLLGVTASQIEGALYNAYGSRQVSTIYTPNNEYWVMIELLPQFQRDVSALSLLYIRSATGDMVPLSEVATLVPVTGPLTVNHTGQLPSVTLSFNLAPDVSLSSAVTEVDRVARATLPATITTSFSGTAQAFQDTQQGLLLLLAVAILVIYMVLGVLYESFIHPITILSALPFAAFGALLSLMVFRTEVSLYAFVGIIMLVGLVKKNGIMMVDFALEVERKEHKDAATAIMEACAIRFRPIMMTTMSALMGTLPIALGFGTGSEARRPLGIAVVGGLAFSQLITLYVTPVIYTYLDAFSKVRVKARQRHAIGAPALAPQPGAD
jgi:HAE1 family hydrophobic/amphiphilic exporter-1